MDAAPATPDPTAAVLARLDAIDARLAAVERLAAGWPVLMDTDTAAAFLGMGRSAFYAAAKHPSFPKRVQTPGGRKFKRAELQRWADARTPGRPRREPVSVET